MYVNIKKLSHRTLNVTLKQLTKSSLWLIRVSVSASSDSTGAAKQVLVLFCQYYSCKWDVGSAGVEKLNANMSVIKKKKKDLGSPPPLALCFALQNICCSVSVHYIGLQLKCVWCQEFPVHSSSEVTTLCRTWRTNQPNCFAGWVNIHGACCFQVWACFCCCVFFFPLQVTPFLVWIPWLTCWEFYYITRQ